MATDLQSNVTTEEATLPKLVAPQASPRNHEIVWLNLIVYTYQHFSAVYGLYLLVTSASWSTVAFNCFTYYLCILGVTAGVHRLWSHRSYKAKKPLQIFLMLCNSMANENSIYLWVRDHRLHHKYSDTDGDPHNAARGFFFSHIGWTLVTRHPEAKRRGQLIDISDILNNPVVMFQKRYEMWLSLTLAHIIPTIVPIYFWHERFSTSYHVNMLRYILSVNAIFMVNSIAHMYGTRPYDKTILPAQNVAANLITLGEGCHNYHHAFPYDYKTGELGRTFNFTTNFIEFCAWLGLVYDRKFASQDMINQRMMRTGESSLQESS